MLSAMVALAVAQAGTGSIPLATDSSSEGTEDNVHRRAGPFLRFDLGGGYARFKQVPVPTYSPPPLPSSTSRDSVGASMERFTSVMR